MPVLNLTAQFIKGLQPPATGRVEYWDSGTPGLCLRVTAAGAASWSFRYRPRQGGKRNERVTFGSLDALTLADARDRAAKVRAEVIDGGNPQHTRRKQRDEAKHVLTFDMLAHRYLEEHAKPNKASWKDDEQRLGRPRKALGHRDATSLTRRDIITFLDALKRTAPVQANRTQTIICTMFNWAVEEELLDNNPVAGLKKRAKETASARTLTDAEIRVLWAELARPREMTVDVAEALKALLLTGQRPGEVAGAVQRELVNLDDAAGARWEIPAERMKARRPHVLPLAPMTRIVLEDALARRRAEADRVGVFASRFAGRNTLARHSLSQALRRIVRRLDPEDDSDAVRSLREHPPTPHDFRRTAATGMAALGIPREDRKAVLAHVPGDIHGSVYDRYERLREKRVALETWERHVARVLGMTT